jgi:hypothetical protein
MVMKNNDISQIKRHRVEPILVRRPDSPISSYECAACDEPVERLSHNRYVHIKLR